MDSRKHILIVDDEEDIRYLFSRALQQDGHEVETTGDPATGLDRIREGDVVLVILDIRMPGMDGLEFLTRAREMSPSLPIILCSAYGSYKEDFRTWGADDFIVKNLDLTQLRAAVRRFTDNDGTADPSAAEG